MHEAQGRGRRAFALFQAARHPGPLVWIVRSHVPELPMLHGLPRGVGARLHLLRPVGETDLLWCAEEALRAAPVALVIAEPEKPLSLTAGRRLQLTAEAGGTTGLVLIRQDAASTAAETRWACEPPPAASSRLPAVSSQLPAVSPDSTLHQWSLGKNKKGTLGKRVLDWDGTSAAFDVVSEARERHEPADKAG